MKKILVLVVFVVAMGGWLFSQYWYFLPGIIQGFLDPIGEYQDVFPTVLAAAGANQPDDRVIDGVDVLSHALSQPQMPLDRPLFWRTRGVQSGAATRVEASVVGTKRQDLVV